jgi:hypothetical protein
VILKALTRLNDRSTLRHAAEELAIIVRVRRTTPAGSCTQTPALIASVWVQQATHQLVLHAGPGSGEPVSAGAEHLHNHRSMGAKASGEKGGWVGKELLQQTCSCTCLATISSSMHRCRRSA